MLKKINLFITLGAFIVATFFVVNSAQAFSISPLRYTIIVDPGTTQKINVAVSADPSEAAEYQLSVVGVTQAPDGHPLFEKKIDVAESWVKPEDSTIKLKTQKINLATFFVAVPRAVSAGTHYLGLVVEPIIHSSGTTIITGRLIVFLVLQVAGRIKEAVSLSSALPRQIFTSSLWPLQLELINTGTVSVPLKGSVSVTGWGKQTLLLKDISVGNQLLPGTVRLLNPSLDFSNSKLWPGWYRLTTAVTYGQTKQTATAVNTLLYLPVWSIAASAIIFMVLLLFVIFRKKLL